MIKKEFKLCQQIQKKASSSSRSRTKQAEIVMEQQLDVAEFANNSHQTEYTLMMHKYADLDKREKKFEGKEQRRRIGCCLHLLY